MAKKKMEKKEKKETSITMDDLAMMVNKGFQSITDQVSGLEGKVGGLENRVGGLEEKMGKMNDRIGNLEDGFETLKDEIHIGLKVNGSIERVERRVNHHEEEILKTKKRVTFIENKLEIPLSR